MDKETLSNYGWIVIAVLVLAVMIALATPFGTFVSDAVKSTTQGMFDVNYNALESAGITIQNQTFWEAQNGAKIYYDRVYVHQSDDGVAAGIWNRDGSITLYLGNMHRAEMCDKFVTVPASQVVISGNRVSHPDVIAPEYGDLWYDAINDGETVSAATFWYTWLTETKEITSREYLYMVECSVTDYTSIETWYNDTFN